MLTMRPRFALLWAGWDAQSETPGHSCAADAKTAGRTLQRTSVPRALARKPPVAVLPRTGRVLSCYVGFQKGVPVLGLRRLAPVLTVSFALVLAAGGAATADGGVATEHYASHPLHVRPGVSTTPTGLSPGAVKSAYNFPTGATAGPARRSPSWTPTTIRTSKPTSACSAASSACRHAPPRTGASAKSTRPAARSIRAPTRDGHWRSPLTSSGPTPSPRGEDSARRGRQH
ncbi:hypothetical protein AHiyo8_00100 [Arthrobacter sp. Hiyo8]|nr:hypothetical protein AHiyo8_00100 [Arthrobacter sp. Hiyo8]